MKSGEFVVYGPSSEELLRFNVQGSFSGEQDGLFIYDSKLVSQGIDLSSFVLEGAYDVRVDYVVSQSVLGSQEGKLIIDKTAPRVSLDISR